MYMQPASATGPILSLTDVCSPLKAIDFGLASWFDPNHLPRTDLGLEGTPWYAHDTHKLLAP